MSGAPFRAVVAGALVTAAALVAALATGSAVLTDVVSALLAPAVGAAGLLLGVRRHRPASPLPWLMLLAGTLLVVGPRAATVRGLVGDEPALFAVGGLGTVLSIVAPLLLLRRRTGVPDRDGALDGWIVALSLAALFRQVLSGGPGEQAVPAVFTAVLTLVAGVTLAAAVRLVFLSWRLPSAWFLLAACAAGQAIGLSVARTDLGAPTQPTAAIVFGTLNTLLVGLAAAHPSMSRLTVPADRLDTLPRARMVLLAGALLMAVVAILGEAGPEAVLSVTGASVVLVLCLVLTRLVRLVSQREHARRLQALVAGLGGRALDEPDRSALLAGAAGGLAQAMPADLVAVLEVPGAGGPVQVVEAQGRDDCAAAVRAALGGTGGPGRGVDDLRELLPGVSTTAVVPGTDLVLLAHRRRRSASMSVDERTVLVTVAALLATALRRQVADARIRHDALHDALTGLPNRAWLLARLEELAGEGRPVGVLFVDLDRFKDVNDALGHAAGDDLLVQVARRVEAVLPEPCVLARLAGDEFVVVAPGPAARDATALAGRVADAVARPFPVAGAEVSVGCSVGVAVGSAEGGEALLHRADLAMYARKTERRSGGDRRRLGASAPVPAPRPVPTSGMEPAPG